MFKWKDSYSVNVKEIDEQHKRLFDLAFKLLLIYELIKGAILYSQLLTKI